MRGYFVWVPHKKSSMVIIYAQNFLDYAQGELPFFFQRGMI
jgi:hypothetical protein